MSDSLYGAPQATLEPARPQPPTLLEQVEGVFTAPKALFERLRQAPSWGPALILIVILGLVATVAWGLKVDADAMMRPGLEANPQMTADQIDQAIQIGSKFLLAGGIFVALIIVPIALLVAGLINWGLGRAMTEPGAATPSFLQGLAAAVVPGLVRLPDTLVIIAMCLLKPVGGHRPEQVAPTSLGYFIHVASPKLQALLYQVNPFIIANFALTYLAMRRIVKAKPLGAAISIGIWILLILVGAAFAK